MSERFNSTKKSIRIRPYTHQINFQTIKHRPKTRPLSKTQCLHERDQNKLIKDSILKIQNENAYKYIIKMNEADDLCNNLKIKKRFKLVTKSDGTIKCELWEKDRFKREMKIEEFEREYKKLKKKYFEKMELNIWNRNELRNHDKLNFDDLEVNNVKAKNCKLIRHYKQEGEEVHFERVS